MPSKTKRQHYAFTFDLDTVAMRNAGVTVTQRTQIYEKEVKTALAQQAS